MLIIRNAHVVTPGKDLGVVDVVVDQGMIVSVGAFPRNAQISPVGAFPRNAQISPVGAFPRNAQFSPVGAFPRNAQVGKAASAAGIVHARLTGSSRNCPHESFASGCDDSAVTPVGESASPVGAFPRNAQISPVGAFASNAQVSPVGAFPRNASDEIIDATGLTLLPGFVDIHSHGRGGADFCDATDEAFEKIGRGKVQDGVTSFLATGLTQSEETLAEMCRCVERYKEKCAFHGNAPTGAAATCLGVHLEGPFFNAAMAGAQNPAFLRDPDADFVLRLNAITRILKVSLAPELPGAEACIRTLADAGIVVSLGHSSADYDTFERARAAGATHLTHFCNAMMPIHHLRPTMVTGGLLADDVYAEIITDGVHLSDPMIRLIAKAKGPDRLMIITDAMCAAGEPDGIYSLGGLRVKVENGKATLADVPYDPKAVVSNVAGSVALFPQCFKRFVAATGWPLHEAVKAVGYNQLRSLGITDRGEVKAGQIADLVLVDGALNPQLVICRGAAISVGAFPRNAQISPVGAFPRNAQVSPVGAFPRNAQVGEASSTAGIVQARLSGSSRNCPHGKITGSSRNCPHGSFALCCDDSAEYRPSPPNFHTRLAQVRIWHGVLPHWQQANVATFVTLRAAGSLPRERLEELREYDDNFRGRSSANCASFPRGRISAKCALDSEWRDYLHRRREMIEKWLDAGEGLRPFASDAVRQAIEASLWRGCSERYDLYSFVVMPNHVHILMQPHDEFLEKDLASFKRFSASAVNRLNGTTGRVWQLEHYDALIRDEEHFRRVRDYIWNNDAGKAWDCWRSGAFHGNATTGEMEGAECAFHGNAPTGEMKDAGCAFHGNATTGEMKDAGCAFHGNATTGEMEGAECAFPRNATTGEMKDAECAFHGNATTGSEAAKKED